jgi:hypothetical protein
MVKNSTLFYLVDDFSKPSEMLITPFYERTTSEDQMNLYLDMVEYDPGEALVKKVLQRAEKEKEPLQ